MWLKMCAYLSLDRDEVPTHTESSLVFEDLVGDFVVHDVTKMLAGRAPKGVNELADIGFQRLHESLRKEVRYPFHFRVLWCNAVSTRSAKTSQKTNLFDTCLHPSVGETWDTKSDSD